MANWTKIIVVVLAFSVSPGLVRAQDAKDPTEDDYYKLESYTLPKGAVLEIGGLQFFEGKIALSTRRGDIYLVEDALAGDITKAKFKLFSSGLHEVLGITEKDGWLYATQRCEVSRLKDEDGDGRADIVETVCDKWGITGDYHEYAFGSKFDKNGDIWVVLCLTGSFNSNIKYRGWCVRVSPDGKMTPTCSGIRSPGGIAANHEGDMFYTDNQGPWNGTCSLKHLKPGSFQGHPGGNKWYDLTNDVIGKRPNEPKSGSRMMTEFKRVPELVPPAIYFPYKKMGQSASGIACDTSNGKFGVFKNQMFVGDQTFSTVMRCSMEKVNGYYQGACFPFKSGFNSGSLAVEFMPDGTMVVGSTNRGWGSRGRQPFAMDRLRWTGKIPFEIHEMNARPDGFELTFTQPVDAKTASDVASYKMTTYSYVYQASYGSPEVDHTTPTIDKVVVADDGKSAQMYVTGLQEGHVHELHSDGVRSQAGLPLLHKEAYYTLNFIPKKN